MNAHFASALLFTYFIHILLQELKIDLNMVFIDEDFKCTDKLLTSQFIKSRNLDHNV